MSSGTWKFGVVVPMIKMRKGTVIVGLMLVILLAAGCTHVNNASNSNQSQNNTANPVPQKPYAPGMTINLSTSTITISNCTSSPKSLLIRKNSEATFFNNDSVAHNLTFFTLNADKNYTMHLGAKSSLRLNYSAHPSLILNKPEYAVIYYCDQNDANYSYIIAADSNIAMSYSRK